MKTVGTAKFVKVHQRAVIPAYQTDLSAACDLYVVETFSLLPRQQELVGTGLVCIPPEGYHWEVYLRSSSTFKWPGVILANCVGIIDSDYIGPEDELKLNLMNYSSDRTLVFRKGERICQMQLKENIRPTTMEEISHEEIRSHESRGGFGSTD